MNKRHFLKQLITATPIAILSFGATKIMGNLKRERGTSNIFLEEYDYFIPTNHKNGCYIEFFKEGTNQRTFWISKNNFKADIESKYFEAVHIDAKNIQLKKCKIRVDYTVLIPGNKTPRQASIDELSVDDDFKSDGIDTLVLSQVILQFKYI